MSSGLIKKKSNDFDVKKEHNRDLLFHLYGKDATIRIRPAFIEPLSCFLPVPKPDIYPRTNGLEFNELDEEFKEIMLKEFKIT